MVQTSAQSPSSAASFDNRPSPISSINSSLCMHASATLRFPASVFSPICDESSVIIVNPAHSFFFTYEMLYTSYYISEYEHKPYYIFILCSKRRVYIEESDNEVFFSRLSKRYVNTHSKWVSTN